MKNAPGHQKGLERSRIMLELLQSVQRDGEGSQRQRASEFGVALGLVNAYINYCIKKGHIRVKKIPTKRYVYYLTPKGFAEKSRLALTLISNSFRSFRQARQDYSTAFRTFKLMGFSRVVLVGMSELAEVSIICAAENDITLAAIIDPNQKNTRFANLPIVSSFGDIPGGFDGAIVTDLISPRASYENALNALGADRVLAPAILGITPPNKVAQTEEAAE